VCGNWCEFWDHQRYIGHLYIELLLPEPSPRPRALAPCVAPGGLDDAEYMNYVDADNVECTRIPLKQRA
jgi:hypothetical protein